MKIAIHNVFYPEEVAETELAQRIRVAANNIGWTAAELTCAADIRAYNPDLVLCLHFSIAKITGYPTYGCMWNPLFFFQNDANYVKNISSYDGYLCASEGLSRWLQDNFYNTPKKFIKQPFYPSCNATLYNPPRFDALRLAYVGSNWDGERFKELFLELANTGNFDAYGRTSGWAYLGDAYRHPLPFDGTSVVQTLNQAGVGLCLHREEHRQAHLPSMRIFEIVAAGAIAICDQHPFIQQHFGDRVLYVDSTLSARETAQQITAHLDWINTHKTTALEMSEAAHKVFVEQFSLEKLLTDLAPHHEALVQQKGFVKPAVNAGSPAVPEVQLIMRVGERSTAKINRALEGIAQQTYPHVSAIIVQYSDRADGLDTLMQTYQTKFPIRLLRSPNNGLRSTSLWQGLGAVTAPYFGILDDDDTIHPNHIQTLVTLLDQYSDYGVAYSAGIQVWEYDSPDQALPEDFKQLPDLSRLSHFRPFNLREMMSFRNFIVSNSFIARSTLIAACLNADPGLTVFEDFLLLLSFARKTRFMFSYEATCEFYHRLSKQDNSVLNSEQSWQQDMARVKQMMQDCEFTITQTIGEFDRFTSTFEILQTASQDFPAKLQYWQDDMATLHHQLQQAQTELAQSQFQLQQTQSELAELRPTLQHVQAELGSIMAERDRKFWKLRKIWQFFKQRLRSS
jgi:cob(I)alamin adenosyltransferase